MERDGTKLTQRKTEIEGTLRDLDKFYFNRNNSTRLISGICIGSGLPNENKDAFIARGVDYSLPVPLLWNHDWCRPLGLVLGLKVCGDELHFNAEIGNNMQWVDKIWQAIITRNAADISIEGHSLLVPVIDRTLTSWYLTEISVVQSGADSGAYIDRCLERLPVVSLTRPSETEHWNDQYWNDQC